jgi:hypothetical protein
VAADEAGLRIIDVSNPSAPVEVGSYNTIASDVAVGGNYAYVTSDRGGLLVLDITNPASPQREALLTNPSCTQNDWNRVAIDGSYAYVTCIFALHILDVSTPSNPIEVGHFSNATVPEGGIQHIAVMQGHAYLSSYGNLRVVDVSNPIEPVAMSSYPTGWGPEGLVAKGDFVYLANGTGVRVIDISNPTVSSAEIGAFLVPSVGYIAPCCNYNHELGGIYGGHAYVASDLGLKIVGLQDPTLPVVNTYRLSEEYPAVGSLRISGDYAYATIGGDYQRSWAHGRGELRILDLTTPTHPTEVGSYVVPIAVGHISDVSTIAAVSGNYAYLTTGSRREELRILDVSNPANPTKVGSYFAPATNEKINQVAVQGDVAYLTTFRWDPTIMGWFRVIDIRNPADPRGIASRQYPYRTDMFVAVNGNHAYLSGSGEALRVFDTSNPSNPTEVGSLYDAQWAPLPLTAFGSYVAMSIDITPAESSATPGLRLVDVSDPTAPTEVGFMDIGGVPLPMDANRMFVIEPGTGASWVLDVLGM